MSLSALIAGRRRSLAKLASDEKLSTATVRRFIKVGTLAGGERVRLQSTWIGGRLYVFDYCWTQFVERLNNADRTKGEPVGGAMK